MLVRHWSKKNASDWLHLARLTPTCTGTTLLGLHLPIAQGQQGDSIVSQKRDGGDQLFAETDIFGGDKRRFMLAVAEISSGNVFEKIVGVRGSTKTAQEGGTIKAQLSFMKKRAGKAGNYTYLNYQKSNQN